MIGGLSVGLLACGGTLAIVLLRQPRSDPESDRREKQLLDQSDKVMADVKSHTESANDLIKRIGAVTEKMAKANKLMDSGKGVVDAWMEVGLIGSIDVEAKRAIVDGVWWQSVSAIEGYRTKVVTFIGYYMKEKTHDYSVTVFEDETGSSVGMVHSDGKVAIFR